MGGDKSKTTHGDTVVGEDMVRFIDEHLKEIDQKSTERGEDILRVEANSSASNATPPVCMPFLTLPFHRF